jgi:hypothetical protein
MGSVLKDSKPAWKTWARYLPLVVPLFGLVELVGHFFFSQRAPTEKQWAEVRSLVSSWYKPGQVVVIAPYWAEPMARWKFGDSLMPMREVARPDATRYAEALEVSTMGSHSPELSGWKVIREIKEGKFTLRTVTNPSPPVVTYDFTDHVDPSSAEVRIDQGTSPTICPFTTTAGIEGGGYGGPPTFPSSRFVCAGEPSHVFVGVTIIDDEKARPRRCIWSHPPTNGGDIVTRFRHVPLGNELHGHAGLGWWTERDLAVPPFTIRITVDGETVGQVVHNAGDFWKSFDVKLGAFARRTADVEFHVSSVRGGTHACFEADSR